MSYRLRRVVVLIVWAVVGTVSAHAQVSPVALDVVASVDGVSGSTVPRSVAMTFDAFAAVRVMEGLDLVARPVVSRRAFDGAWQQQVYQLSARYERPAPASGGIGMRFEAGQLASPIGIGVLENRADINPLVSQHSAYYLPLPRVDPEVPRTFLIAGMYPFGGQATLAGRTWDARVAMIDSSPVRGRPMLGANKPPRLLNMVAGFGITPRVGLRFGAAVAQGAYASVDEVQDRTRGDRDATMLQLESEWSFGYTRLAGEWVNTWMETSRDDLRASGGWVEVVQTISPRVFAAARVDLQHIDYQRPVIDDFQTQRYERVETIAGVRLTPDLTLRAGWMVRKGYVVAHWDDQLIGSLVWQRRIR